MTRKQKKLISAIRDGLPLEQAAAIAGYTRDYAQRLLNEPSIIEALEYKPPEAPAKPRKADANDPKAVLQEIISDPTGDEKVKIAAIRALTAIKREEAGPEIPPAVIIDDVGAGCEGCPLLGWLMDLCEVFGPIIEGKEGCQDAQAGDVEGSPGDGVSSECG